MQVIYVDDCPHCGCAVVSASRPASWPRREEGCKHPDCACHATVPDQATGTEG